VLDADTASTTLGDEHAIATSFCQRAAARADRALDQIGDNDDDSIDATVSLLLTRGSYDPPPRSLGDRACSEQWFAPTAPPAHIARD